MTRALNLLPWREWRRQREVRQLQGLLIATVVLAVGAIGLLDRYANHQLARQGQANARLSEAIRQLEAPVAQVSELEAQGEAVRQRAKGLEALLHTASPGAGVLSVLGNHVPPGVQVTTLVLEGTALRVEGLAQGRGAVTELLRTLGHAPSLGDVRLQEAKATAAGDVFQLNAQVLP